jgi:hypothetical protein
VTLVVDAVSVRRGGRVVIDGVTLEVAAGECLCASHDAALLDQLGARRFAMA